AKRRQLRVTAHEVVTARVAAVDVAGDVGVKRGGVAGDDRVGQRGRALGDIEAAADPVGGVAADGDVGQRQRALVVEATALAPARWGDAIIPRAARATLRGVTGQGRADQRGACALVDVDCTTPAPTARAANVAVLAGAALRAVVGEGGAVQRDRPT